MTDTRPAPAGRPDPDAEETREWLDSLDGLVDAGSIVVQVPRRLAAASTIVPARAGEAARRYRLDDAEYFPADVSAGGES